jgi:hypothetical protein
MVGIKSRANRVDFDLTLIYCLDKLLLQIIIQGMATRIRHSSLTKLCGSGVIDLGAARRHRVPTRSFSSTRIFAQDTETAPTHGFSNGQNLGSIALKKNSVYLENKLRIVRRHLPKIHYYSLLIRQIRRLSRNSRSKNVLVASLYAGMGRDCTLRMQKAKTVPTCKC